MNTKDIIKTLRVACAIGEKDAKIYYLKPPSLIFGLLFPFSMFLAFLVGRNIPVDRAIPMLVAQTLFFASSSIGPITIPLERRLKTFDRFLSAPVSLSTILLGKTLAGFAYGTAISMLPIIVGVLFLNSTVIDPAALVAGLIFSAFCFAAMGLLFASIPSQQPGQIMMPLSLVRIPLLFISGIFIPIADLPAWGQILAAFSPLTHTIELIKTGLGETAIFGTPTNIAALLAYLLLFLLVGIHFHKINQKKE